jgi:hypothetical protein
MYRTEKYAQWGLKHNPFIPTAPILDNIRRAVFTGYEHKLDDLNMFLQTAQSCCIHGTYGMGKTFLMLEAKSHLQEKCPEILPVYGRVLPGQDFDMAVLDILYKAIRDRKLGFGEKDAEDLLTVQGNKVEEIRAKRTDHFHLIQELVEYVRSHGLRPAFLIDDVDRVQRVKSMTDTARELNSLDASIVLPSNPNNLTKMILTVGEGIFNTIELRPFAQDQFKLMISRYLETARENSEYGETSSITPPMVFLGHAKEDQARAERLRDHLKSIGYHPWMASSDIRVGEKWEESINKAISTCTFFIACLSHHSVSKRGFIQKEFRMALDRAKELIDGDIFIIPVLFDDCDIPEDFKKYHAVKFNSNGTIEFEQLNKSLSDGLRRRARGMNKHQAQAYNQINLSPFEEQAISYALDRIGSKLVTPRKVLIACKKFLDLAADQDLEGISKKFFETNWDNLSLKILEEEQNPERAIAIIIELAELNGRVDEEIDLETLTQLLAGIPGEFIDFVRKVEEFEDVFDVQEKDGMTTIELSPLISADFVKETLKRPGGINNFLGSYRSRFASPDEV